MFEIISHVIEPRFHGGKIIHWFFCYICRNNFLMITKKAAFVLLLLANIVLLVYAVIPHHHHHEQICLENSHCQNDESTHQHTTPECDHEHDGSRGADHCVLKQAVVFPPNSLRQEIKCTDDDKHAPFWDFSASLLSKDAISFVLKIASKAPISPTTCLHFNFLTEALGLRAPPTV